MYRWTACAAVTVALLASAAPVLAAPGWTPTFSLTGTGRQVAMAPDGTVVFPAFATVDGANRTAVQVRPPGGPLSSLQLLDQPGDATPSVPSIAAGGDGRFVAAWVEGGDVKVAEMAPGASSFGSPISLTDDTATFVWVDVDASGNATVVWTTATPNAVTPTNTDYRLRATLVPADGSAPTTQQLDGALNATPQMAAFINPVLGVTPSGGAMVEWTMHVYTTSAEATYLRAVVRKPGDSSFGSTILIDQSGRTNPTPNATETSLSYPAMAAVGDGGDIGILWWKFTYTGANTGTLEIDYAAASLSSPFSDNPTPDHPITPAELWTLGDLAIDPQGRTTFTFNRYPFANATVRPAYVFRPRGGPWGSVQELGPTSGNTEGLTVAPDGTEMFTYAALGAFAAVAPPGGSFGASHLLATDVPSLQAVAAAIGATGGDGVVTWQYQSQGGFGPYVSDAAGYDVSPPVLNKLTVPSSGTTGDLLAFSVEPFDIWGPVTTTWAFGDDSTGNGASVTHTYSTAGDLTVTATATDSAGHSTSENKPISVTAPPVVTTDQQQPTPTVVDQTPSAAPADTTVPVVSGFAASPATFAVGKKTTALAAKVHRGTTFRFQLSEPAAVAITIARQIPGLRKGTRCVPATKTLTAAILKKAGKRGLVKARCKAFKTLGTLTRSGVAGANAVAFSGKLGRRALGVGRYRATLVATDAAHNASLPAGATFRIVSAR